MAAEGEPNTNDENAEEKVLSMLQTHAKSEQQLSEINQKLDHVINQINRMDNDIIQINNRVTTLNLAFNHIILLLMSIR